MFYAAPFCAVVAIETDLQLGSPLFKGIEREDLSTMIGCPKLDVVDYAEKLTRIFKYNNIRSVTVTRMTVPCCGDPYVVRTAIEQSGKDISLHIATIAPITTLEEDLKAILSV